MLFFVLLVVVLLGTPRIGTLVANLFDYSGLDPDGAFLWISVHHIIQGIIILALMFLFSKVFKIDFHLGWGDKQTGIRYLKRFMLIFLIYASIVFAITIPRNFQPFQYPLSTRNIAGYLGFQLLLSGPSEELIFRAFAITMFALLISNRRVFRHLSHANLFAAIVFGIAHIQIFFNPFELKCSLPQVFYSIALGFFYGDCYEKSKSVLYPMIMHSFTNVVMVGVSVFFTFIL